MTKKTVVVTKNWRDGHKDGLARAVTDIEEDPKVLEWLTGIPAQDVDGQYELHIRQRVTSQLQAQKDCQCLAKRISDRLKELGRDHA